MAVAMNPEYDPYNPIDAEEWLALSELERTDLVSEYHLASGIEVPSLEAHASFHVVVENQIAEDVPEVRTTLARLMKEGLDRHDAIHAIGTVLADNIRLMFGSSEDDDADAFMKSYASDLKNFTAQAWFDDAGFEDSDDLYDEELPEFTDHRAHERQIANMHSVLAGKDFTSEEELQHELDELARSGDIPDRVPQTDLEEAQDVIYSAWEESDPRERIRLAREALEISRDCADAYVLLAEEAAVSLDEAEELLRRGMKAGERALGPEAFKQDEGHFWGILETRPYMRARHGLATILGLKEEREEAIHHLQELIRLNPQDNQGTRGMLAEFLFRDERDEELAELMKQYEGDADLDMAYTRALWLFRKVGDCDEANRALKEALERNSYVPSYLLGKRKIPKDFPQFAEFGGPEHAAEYAQESLSDWRSTPGALFWLRRHTGKRKRR
jgi:tetratricopeptide (TPR) repeat protein